MPRLPAYAYQRVYEFDSILCLKTNFENQMLYLLLFENKFSKPILQSYGLCETLINTIQSPRNKSAPSSVGRSIGPSNAIQLGKDRIIKISNNSLYSGVIKEPNKLQAKGIIKNSFKTKN